MRVYEGDILTVDAQDSVARYLVEDDGRILFVGDDLPAEYEEVPVEHLRERGGADVFPTQNVLCDKPQRFSVLHGTHASQ